MFVKRYSTIVDCRFCTSNKVSSKCRIFEPNSTSRILYFSLEKKKVQIQQWLCNSANKQTGGPEQMKTEWIFYAHMQTFFSYRGLRLFHQVGLFLQPMKPVNISESQQKESRSQPFNGHLMVWCWIFYHVINQIEDEIFTPVQKIR